MKLPHEPGTMPDHPWYYVKAWCVDEARIGHDWFGDLFCFGIDVRIVVLLIICGFCTAEAWLQWKKMVETK